ncbi:MAG: diguanylate cyclase, partial [Hydrogenovibrio sp.]|nr:diguanylate cyclase [Hydrogenovibrio sp.]
MSQQSPEKSLHQQAFSIDDTLKILNLSDKGVILFSKDYQVVLFNQIIEQYDPDIRHHQDPLNDFRLYSQKRKGVRFNLLNWFESCSQNVGDIHFSPQLWLKSSTLAFSIPVALQLNIIEFNQQPHLLLTLADKTLERQQIAHQKLMAANYSGQFITNASGFIAQPNNAFLALTGLSAQELSSLTYIDWLKKQVSFKVPFDHVMSTLLNEHHWTGEVDIFSQSEAQFKAVLSISMLVDPHNNIEHFIGVLQDMTDIEHAHAEINKLSYYDRLTGLANKTRLHEEIGEAIERAKDDATFHALLYIGLDGVKIINDTFGHRAGDDLLVQVAEKLQQRLNDQSTLARLDGSNFAVLYHSTTQERFFALQEITALANELLQTVNGRYNIERGSVHTSASIGSCLFPFEENADYAADQITSFADMAMYEAKKQGGDQVYLFETQLIEKAQKRLELIEALNHSELDEEFQIYFQPQVDKTGKTISAETLIRWFHPELGLVSPSKFIPVAEEGRQIIKIGLWVLHKAFLQIKAWNRTLP